MLCSVESRWLHPLRSLPDADARSAVPPVLANFPLMTGDEYQDFIDDLKANGLQEPIVIFQNQILDGRNRYLACEKAEIDLDLGDPDHFRTFEGDDEAAKKFVWSSNYVRRHLTAEQKLKACEERLKHTPQRSDRAIAKEVGVSPTTVGKVRKELSTVDSSAADASKPKELSTVDSSTEQSAHLAQAAENTGEDLPPTQSRKPHVAERGKRIGRCGKARSLPKAKAANSSSSKPTATKQGMPLSQQRSRAISSLATLLHSSDSLDECLEDFRRILADETKRIVALPLTKRVTLARGFLNVLNVTLDDLGPIGDRTERVAA
jgi:ParB-like chromosome segregation protein Spo0J